MASNSRGSIRKYPSLGCVRPCCCAAFRTIERPDLRGGRAAGRFGGVAGGGGGVSGLSALRTTSQPSWCRHASAPKACTSQGGRRRSKVSVLTEGQEASRCMRISTREASSSTSADLCRLSGGGRLVSDISIPLTGDCVIRRAGYLDLLAFGVSGLLYRPSPER